LYSAEEIKAAGLDDFRVFLRQVWDYLALPAPTPVQNSIARYLQYGPRRRMIQGFRGVGKSWITVAFVLWNLLLDPDKKIMVVSANESTASDFTDFCFQLIEGMEILQHLAPRANQRRSKDKFDVGPARESKDPSVKSVGIKGQLTGSRANIIIPDDIEVPKNSLTHIMRMQISELVKEFDAVLTPGGEIIYLGTPQVEASIYNQLPKRGYEICVWPVEVPARVDIYHGRLAPFVSRMIEKGVPAGTPIDPRRFTQAEINERKQSYGLSGFALQFMLDTNPSNVDKHPLKTRDLILHDCDAEMGHVKMIWGSAKEVFVNDLHSGGFDGDFYVRATWKSEEMARYGGTVMAIDPSGRGNDETAYAVVRVLHGMLYLVAVGGYTDGFAESTLKSLATIAIRHGVNKIIAEENYGGGMFQQLLKPVIYSTAAEAKTSPPTFDEEYDGWSSTQKESRICDTLEPILRSHRLVVDRRVIEQDEQDQLNKQRYSFIQQLTRMERLKGCLPHEDRLEAVSMACGYWVDRMKIDKDKALELHKEELVDIELRRFMENAFFVGNPNAGAPSGYNWRPRR
jgi:hypothetical protein